jgi:PX domain-containing protein kinase-like protein
MYWMQIERNCWNEDWALKYGNQGKGLPISQIQRMGRQVLEAMVFLKERDFPTVSHLHSGNVIVQNGVARLAALENTLLGFTSRIYPVIASRLRNGKNQLAPDSIDTISFGAPPLYFLIFCSPSLLHEIYVRKIMEWNFFSRFTLR